MSLRRPRAALLLLLALAAAPEALASQNPSQQLTQSQKRLQEIRREREQLRRELTRLRSQVRDVSSEVQNIRRQVTASETVLQEIDFQLTETQQRIRATTQELLSTQDRLAERKAVLHHRLRDIYRRGPLHSAEVLLKAESFGDLINRYKYLHLVARHDKGLVREVGELEQQLAVRERQLRRSLTDVQYLKGERMSEHSELAVLQTERGRALNSLQTQARSTTQRIEQLARDEKRLAGLITTLEKRRREAEAAAAARRRAAASAGRPAPAASTAASGESRLSTRDFGALGWPVEGRVLYRFGRTTTPNGTVLRWNGVGIGAPVGTPVRSVEGGTVVLAKPFEGYGPSVVLSHGGGYYSLYLYLKDISVKEGTEISKGQVVGTVGGANTPEGAHVEFQIRAPGGGAVDPLGWLKQR